MVRTLTIGGIPQHDNLGASLVLPLLRGTETVQLVFDALHDAVSRRTGVVVVGEKGTGKSEATRLAVREFEGAERQRQEMDAGYRRRRLLKLPSLVTPKYRDVLFELLKQISGSETRPRVNGVPVSEDALLMRCCTLLFERNVVALLIDQAESCSADALRVLRDLMTYASEMDERRKSVDGVIAAGVGVVIVGTPPLRAVIATNEEMGHRWARVVEVDGVLPEDVGLIYTTWFPGFAAEIARRGEPWWESAIDGIVSKGQLIAIRSITLHMQRYWQHVLSTHPEVLTRELAPLDYDLFRFAADEVVWQRSTRRPRAA